MAPGLWKVIGRSLIGVAAVLGLAFVAGIVVGYASADGPGAADTALVWVLGVVAVLLMGLSLWLGAAWMRSIDEAAREAHKWAWYWGGTGGMAVGGVLMIMASLPPAAKLQLPTPFPDRVDPAAYLATGAFAMMLLMLVGYLLAWGWWWFRRR